MGRSKPSAREIEFAWLLAQMTADEIDEFYGVMIAMRSPRVRTWSVTSSVIIGERRHVTEPVVLERRAA